MEEKSGWVLYHIHFLSDFSTHSDKAADKIKIILHFKYLIEKCVITLFKYTSHYIAHFDCPRKYRSPRLQ